jgi:hypothetical protein
LQPQKRLDEFLAIEARQLMKPEPGDSAAGKLLSFRLKETLTPLASASRQPLFGNGVVHLPARAVQGSEEFEVWHL